MMRFVFTVFIYTVRVCFFFLGVWSTASAQGSIQGMITATEVSGFMVIACFADAELGCNEALSNATPITASGSSATYNIDNLSAGQYIVFLWRDTNNSGDLEDTQDEVHYYATGGEEVSLVSPPASTINFTLTSTNNPLTTTPTNSAQDSGNQTLIGSWSNYGELGKYLTGNKTAKLDLTSSVARTFVFNPDGTYTSLSYNENYNDAADSYGPCVWKRVQGIYQTQDDVLVTEIRSEEHAYCGLELQPVSITTPLEQFIWRAEENGLGILDVTELQSVDESYWNSGYAYHVIKDAASSNPSSNPLTQTSSQNPSNTSASTTSGVIAPEYVGVWVDDGVRVSVDMTQFGAFESGTGTMSMSGYDRGGRFLKIFADGSYSFYSSTAVFTCATVVTSQGQISIEETQLTLYPTSKQQAQRFIGTGVNTDCPSTQQELTPTPETLPLEFSEADSRYVDWRTYSLTVTASDGYWQLNKVMGSSPTFPAVQEPPYNYAGTDAMYQELVGHWFVADDLDSMTAEQKTPVNFYNASTGAISAERYASSLNFYADGTYEIVTYRPSLLRTEICARNLLLIERGATRFDITYTDEELKSLMGNLMLMPTASTLQDELINCDTDNYQRTMSLPATPRYLSWNLTLPNSVNSLGKQDGLSLGCPDSDEAPQWIFLFCQGSNNVFHSFQRQ